MTSKISQKIKINVLKLNQKGKNFSLRLLIMDKQKIEIFNPGRSIFKMLEKNKGICKIKR
jgi:hypothetical protein